MKIQNINSEGNKMKRIFTVLILVLSSGLLFSAPKVKIVTSYVTPHMLEENSAFTADSTVASGLNVLAKGTYAYVKAWNFGDTAAIISATWTLLSKPVGSGATINPVTGLSWWANFKADSSGTYEIKVSITTSTGTKDTTTKIYGSTYVGTGNYDNVPAMYPNCMSCHGSTPQFIEIFNKWKVSDHATNFQKNITTGSPFFGTNCFKCHTTGYDQNIVASNNGFDDKARQLGWDWSNYSPPKPSNWDTLKNRFSPLVAFAGVGCESCHGPGLQHVVGGGDTNKIAVSLDAGVCGKCHDEPPEAPIFGQWENSLHAEVVWSNSFAQNNNGTNNLDNCIRCHDGTGYVNYTNGVGTYTNGFSVANQVNVTCAVCHDPHGGPDHQLRKGPVNGDTLANGYRYSNVGDGEVCMNCHKARKNVDTYTLTRVNSANWGPHHSGQADVYEAQNVALFGGPPYQTTAHKDFLVNSCVKCHMPPTDTTLVNKDKVGGHTMSIHNDENDFDYLAGCQSCHFGKTRFDQFIAPFDYDGDGTIESWIAETEGCEKNLRIALPPVGIDSVAWQLIAADSNNIPLRQAYFNYLLIHEGSEKGMHNPKFSVDVLIRSKQVITGVTPVYTTEVPDKYVLSQNYPNPFNPSTKINFSIPKQSVVIVTIYDITGREVKTLMNQKLASGNYSIDWHSVDNSGGSVASGVYFYRIKADNFSETKRMMLIR
jgi:hypothetical protein